MLLLALLVAVVVAPTAAVAAEGQGQGNGNGNTPTEEPTSEEPTEDPTEEPTPEEPTPDPSETTSEAPSEEPTDAPTTEEPTGDPSTTPEPTPSPTESCFGQDEESTGVTFGDVDRDCDGVLLLSEQGDPITVRRTVDLAPEGSDVEGETEDRFEPTDFVPGVLVGFDETSEQGGTITEGSLIYTPPPGFTGEDRFTFLVEGDDGIVRQAEVLVTVAFVEVEGDEEPTETEEPTEDEVVEDAVDRALGAQEEVVVDLGDRWDPPWLRWMSLLAGVLVALTVLWWLFLELRIQDRLVSAARRDG